MTGLPAPEAPLPPEAVPRRARVAWCLYDWANSAFPTVIVTFVFASYFTGSVAPDPVSGTSLWAYAVAVSGVLIALLSPVVGAIADQTGRRKPWLAACSVVTIVAAGALWFVEPVPASILFALVVFAIANIFFEVGQVFYNAMLPTIVPLDRIGRLSGWGWGLGYAGGLSCLVVLLVVFVQPKPPPFGLDPSMAEHVRTVGPIVAAWFAVFCVPLFLFVPDVRLRSVGARQAIVDGLTTLIATVKRVRDYRTIGWFLAARLFYVDGMNTMFAFGAIYASGTFGFSQEEVIQFAIAMNVAAGAGAAAMGFVDDRIGSKRTILIALAGLMAFGIPLLLVETKLWFWILAIPLGLFMGPAQASSRTLMARLAPAEYRTEMFGLFAFSGRATAYVGPFLLGVLTAYTGSQRIGLAVVPVFLAIGAAILLTKVRD
jgi:UMF1 family MFS transporter